MDSSQVRVLVLTTFIGLALAFSWTSSAQLRQADEVPLPADLEIIPPDSSISPEKAAFSGQWGDGKDKWHEILAHILVVEKVDEKGAQVVYAHGTASTWSINAPSWVRVRGTFTEKNELVVQLRRGTATYRLNGDKLEGSYSARACCYKIALSRVKRVK